jgi:hypothetical protein
MVQRITPVKTQMVTQDGECHVTITLELNINVNGEVSAQAVPVVEEKRAEPDKVELVIPDFSSGQTMKNF